GTALAMQLAREGNPTVLWASDFDRRVLPDLLDQRRHPSLPAYLPDSLHVLGPERLQAAAGGVEVAVMAAHSGGARTLARVVVEQASLPLTVSIAKGLEPHTKKRMTEVYAEEVGHSNVVAMGGPCLAGEIASGAPTAAVVAAVDPDSAAAAARCLRGSSFDVVETNDVLGVE